MCIWHHIKSKQRGFYSFALLEVAIWLVWWFDASWGNYSMLSRSHWCSQFEPIASYSSPFKVSEIQVQGTTKYTPQSGLATSSTASATSGQVSIVTITKWLQRARPNVPKYWRNSFMLPRRITLNLKLWGSRNKGNKANKGHNTRSTAESGGGSFRIGNL